MEPLIHETGYWLSENSESHHIHSEAVSAWIVKFLSDDPNKQIYDFGCGLGNYLLDLHRGGFTHLTGIEGDPMRTDLPFPILTMDLSGSFNLSQLGTVICLEVGEHIPAQYTDTFLDNIANACDGYLITSWAVRQQTGYGHFNELNNDEIIPRFEARGFTYLEQLSEELRLVPEDKCSYFRETLMVFRK